MMSTAEPPVEGIQVDLQPQAGLGVDIIEIDRMERAFTRVASMKEKLFSAAEISYAESKSRPITHFALFFAAKEAVLKALGTGFSGMAWTDVEVDHDRFGRPFPKLSGAAEKHAAELEIVEIQLSLSYTHQVAVASAVAIKKQDRPPQKDQNDPKAELLRQFRDMRGMLDGMDERLRQLETDNDEHPKQLETDKDEHLKEADSR
ncbi:MAG: holo-ACP synthase [Coriobacteriales bacterium]|jgi:holo-[acyl-carrier protein] synthase|nr:holo-ACP synthase [Coriobacteriales bacterium]